MCRNFHLALLMLTFFTTAAAQDNYEIQVYGSDTVAKGAVLLELHSNYTAKGFVSDNHAFHETLEITRGFNDWFETGFYIFTSARGGDGWQFVGSHIRPRVRVPARWQWPVGVSLSTEIGWASSRFSDDTWSWEVRPIIDKTLGRWYLSFNPALEKSLHGANSARGFALAPAINIKYDLTRRVAAGVEYYGGLRSPQSHQIFPAIDLNFSPDWELNAGVGIGLTKSTDKAIVKVIVGRRMRWP